MDKHRNRRNLCTVRRSQPHCRHLCSHRFLIDSSALCSEALSPPSIFLCHISSTSSTLISYSYSVSVSISSASNTFSIHHQQIYNIFDTAYDTSQTPFAIVKNISQFIIFDIQHKYLYAMLMSRNLGTWLFRSEVFLDRFVEFSKSILCITIHPHNADTQKRENFTHCLRNLTLHFS